MRNDNRGLSLVELIVVIGMISVLVGLGALGLRFYSSRDAKKTADNIKITLENARIDALAKETMTLTVWADDAGVMIHEVATVGVDGSGNPVEKINKTQRIGGKDSKVKFLKSDGATLVDLGTDEASGTVFTFRRDTGGFASPLDIKEIQVTKAGKTYTLKLQQFTGKVIAEY